MTVTETALILGQYHERLQNLVNVAFEYNQNTNTSVDDYDPVSSVLFSDQPCSSLLVWLVWLRNCPRQVIQAKSPTSQSTKNYNIHFSLTSPDAISWLAEQFPILYLELNEAIDAAIDGKLGSLLCQEGDVRNEIVTINGPKANHSLPRSLEMLFRLIKYNLFKEETSNTKNTLHSILMTIELTSVNINHKLCLLIDRLTEFISLTAQTGQITNEDYIITLTRQSIHLLLFMLNTLNIENLSTEVIRALFNAHKICLIVAELYPEDCAAATASCPLILSTLKTAHETRAYILTAAYGYICKYIDRVQEASRDEVTTGDRVEFVRNLFSEIINFSLKTPMDLVYGVILITDLLPPVGIEELNHLHTLDMNKADVDIIQQYSLKLLVYREVMKEAFEELIIFLDCISLMSLELMNKLRKENLLVILFKKIHFIYSELTPETSLAPSHLENGTEPPHNGETKEGGLKISKSPLLRYIILNMLYTLHENSELGKDKIYSGLTTRQKKDIYSSFNPDSLGRDNVEEKDLHKEIKPLRMQDNTKSEKTTLGQLKFVDSKSPLLIGRAIKLFSLFMKHLDLNRRETDYLISLLNDKEKRLNDKYLSVTIDDNSHTLLEGVIRHVLRDYVDSSGHFLTQILLIQLLADINTINESLFLQPDTMCVLFNYANHICSNLGRLNTMNKTAQSTNLLMTIPAVLRRRMSHAGLINLFSIFDKIIDSNCGLERIFKLLQTSDGINFFRLLGNLVSDFCCRLKLIYSECCLIQIILQFLMNLITVQNKPLRSKRLSSFHLSKIIHWTMMNELAVVPAHTDPAESGQAKEKPHHPLIVLQNFIARKKCGYDAKVVKMSELLDSLIDLMQTSQMDKSEDLINVSQLEKMAPSEESGKVGAEERPEEPAQAISWKVIKAEEVTEDLEKMLASYLDPMTNLGRCDIIPELNLVHMALEYNLTSNLSSVLTDPIKSTQENIQSAYQQIVADIKTELREQLGRKRYENNDVKLISLQHRNKQQKGQLTTIQTARNARKFVAPMRGRGFILRNAPAGINNPYKRGDYGSLNQQIDPAQVSRPSSMHVDDFSRLEKDVKDREDGNSRYKWTSQRLNNMNSTRSNHHSSSTRNHQPSNSSYPHNKTTISPANNSPSLAPSLQQQQYAAYMANKANASSRPMMPNAQMPLHNLIPRYAVTNQPPPNIVPGTMVSQQVPSGMVMNNLVEIVTNTANAEERN